MMGHPATKSGSRRQRILQRIQWLMTVTGLSLLLIAALSAGHRSFAARAALDEFNDIKGLANEAVSGDRYSAESATPELAELASAPTSQALWSDQAKAHWLDSLQGNVAPPIAVLEIPRLSMRYAVLADVDERSLHRSVGWIPGTARPGDHGNVAIAGHRDSHFRGLKDIRIGDRITLDSLQGSTTFEVSELRIVSPEDNYVLADDGRARLTLVTCFPFYYVGAAPQRWIVTAEPVGGGVHADSSGTAAF